MTIKNLEFFFEAKSAVLVGASRAEGSIGLTIARNMKRSGFEGQIGFVNPKYSFIEDIACWSSVEHLPFVPAVAIVATPPETVPGVIASLGRKGCRAAVVITAGIRDDLRQAMLDAARPTLLRIIGPNCMGLQVPGIGLDGSFAQTMASSGQIAVLSQSGAILTAMLDWAAAQNVGLSHVVSMGDMADVDLGDMLDYLAGDASCRAIFLYMESVTNAPKFMSAARRASRVKPVIAIKAGRREEGARAAASHTGALVGSDKVYDAALRRAGVLRVYDLDEMFEAAEMLARVRDVPCEGRLTIVTNGGGAGVLAADRLGDEDGVLAPLAPETVAALDTVLPPTWSRANPIDIIGDAGPQRYRSAVAQALADPTTDALLVINCPTALASSFEAAEATMSALVEHRSANARPKPLVAAWLGRHRADGEHGLFLEHRVPDYATPSAAVRGFMQLLRYRRAQEELLRAPPSLPDNLSFDMRCVDAAIRQAGVRGRTMMTEPEAKDVLRAYGIPTVPTFIAQSPADVERFAAEILDQHASCVVKILSEQLPHKSDLGGVRLDIDTAAAARDAAEQMLVRIGTLAPHARLDGFTVQPMVRKVDAYEVILGVTSDPTFGPVMMFGAGGTAVEAIGDTAMGLPPLDLKFARDLIEATRICRLLKGYRDKPPVDLDALALVLVRLSYLAVQHPEIRELDVNPLLVDHKGMIALDARIRIAGADAKRAVPPSIRPYPREWEAEKIRPNGAPILVRPLRPDDLRHYADFLAHVTPDDLRLRLFAPARGLSPDLLAKLTQIDYAREMAFIALEPGEQPRMLGEVRFFADPDYTRAEYAVLVRSDLKGQGLGWILMQHLISYAQAEGLKTLYGNVLRENTTMLQMCGELGFRQVLDPDDPGVAYVELDIESLRRASAAA